MNDKITIQELVEFISGNQSTSKKEIETFAKEFFKLIEDALQTERYVKIKGFGTFQGQICCQRRRRQASYCSENAQRRKQTESH